MYKKQLRQLVKNTLEEIGLYSPEAVNLIMGTIAQESHLAKYIEQIKGPADGICQMEPATHNDIWKHFLKYKPELIKKLDKISATDEFTENEIPDSEEMVWNMKYAIAMCRVHYLRKKGAIPFSLQGQAEYWKKHYNTHLGAGTVEEYLKNYQRFVA